MKAHLARIAALSVLLAALIVAVPIACNGSSEIALNSGNSRIRVLITDAPADYIESADVTISRVYLVPADGSTPVDLLPASASPVTYDLMELRNGVEALLADNLAPAGEYSQLRLIVDDATVTLIPGLTFNDGTMTRTLKVPSGMETGIKVETQDPIDLGDGLLTIVVVDFDVDANFVLQGNPATPAGLNGVIFTPVLHEKSRDTVAMP